MIIHIMCRASVLGKRGRAAAGEDESVPMSHQSAVSSELPVSQADAVFHNASHSSCAQLAMWSFTLSSLCMSVNCQTE